MEPTDQMSSLDGLPVYGREFDKERVINLVLSGDRNNSNVTPICVIGENGIGKTTLVQLIYSDRRTDNAFDMRAFVQMTEGSDEKSLMKDIIESLTMSPCDVTEPSMLESIVRDELRDKKVMIILDGAENENKEFWTNMLTLLSASGKGSIILITASRQEVAVETKAIHYYKLNSLPDQICWLIFRQKAFHGQSVIQPKLEKLGKELIARCSNNTLGVNLLGGFFYYYIREEWWMKLFRFILKSNLWFKDRLGEGIVPIVKKCFEELPTHLQRCFMYCSLFPGNHVFLRNDMVHLWLAQGLIKPMVGRELEDIGFEYFDELYCRSFFQHSFVYDANMSSFMMHEVIHAFVQQVARDKFFRCENKLRSVPRDIHHLSLVPLAYDTIEIAGLVEKIRDLRCFLVINRPILKLDYAPFPSLNLVGLNDLFLKFKGLRALDLSNTGIVELPCSIGNVSELKYLNLNNTNIKSIPPQIGALITLQHFEAQNCYYLAELPESIKFLTDLRYLDVTRVVGYVGMPLGIGNLTNLQSLVTFNVGSDELHSGIDQLKSLVHLRGCLLISGLENVKSVSDAEEAYLKYKSNIKSLSFQWTNYAEFLEDDADVDFQEKVLENLQPNTNLEELIIRNYAGRNFPVWTGDHTFSRLISVIIDGCPNCCKLPPLGVLPSLKKLSIQKFYGIETMELSKFPSLESMKIWEMYILETFVLEEGDCPHLQSLFINKCPLLRSIPRFCSLVELSIHHCTQLPQIPDLPSLQSLRIVSEKGEEWGSWERRAINEATKNTQVERRFASISEPVGLQPVLRQLREYFVGPVLACMGLSGIASEARYFFNLDENRRALEESENTLRSAAKSVSIEVTEEIKKLNEIYPEVDDWVDRVNKVLYEKLSDEISINFLCHFTDLFSRFHLGKQVVEKHDRVIKLIDAKKAITKIGYTPGPPAVVPIHQPEPVGLQPVLRQLREYLDDETRSIIGVWGQGGVGKTTLLNAFNNDLVNHRGGFHVVILIDVSNSEALDVVGIQKTITKRLGLPWVDTDEKSRAKDLCRALSKKRSVILLDDVARDFKLEDVGIPFPNNGSKIVLASRDRNVCNCMGAQQNLIGMETLDEAASQELFRRNVGNDVLNAIGADPTIISFMDEITKKCGGLPLALNVMGKSMAGRTNLVDWEYATRAITADLTELEGVEEKMFRKLEYSYDRLGESEKECFLSCTLFPEYSLIKKQQLVEYWMAEELVPADKPWRGYLIINKLVNMCLLQRTNSGLKVRMHSVIREFGLWLANKNNNFLVRSGKGLVNPPPPELFEGPKKISLMDNNLRKISLPTTCNNLQTLLLQNNPNFNSLGLNFFRFTRNLRVLDLSNTAIQEFPELPVHDASIPLQYLNLSKTPIRRLPETFWVLKELRHLDISATENLETTSDNCSKLLKLRVLNLFRSHYGIRDESDLNLDSLKELWFLGIAIHAEVVLRKLKKTDPLARFTNQLSLKHCYGMKSIHVADFNHMEHLNELYIESCDDLRELVVDETRESRLKLLTLWELGRLQSILVKSSPHHFQKLRELTIYECHKLSNISWVAGLDSLEKLILSNCHGIKQVVMEKRNEISREIPAQQGESSQQSNVRSEISTGETSEQKGESSQRLVNGDNKKEFPKLRSIVLIKLINLESICNARVFPCLESIRVQFCPKLRRLPIACKDNIPKLQQIGGSSDWWEELEWDVQEMKGHLEDIFIPYVRYGYWK